MPLDALRDHLDRTDTVYVITQKNDGTERSTPIWSVIADGEPYIRSVDGADGVWFRRQRSSVQAMLKPESRESTLHLVARA